MLQTINLIPTIFDHSFGMEIRTRYFTGVDYASRMDDYGLDPVHHELLGLTWSDERERRYEWFCAATSGLGKHSSEKAFDAKCSAHKIE